MKTFSGPMTAAMGAQETGEEPLVALTIEHAGLPATIRIIDFTTDVVKSGNTYSWWPFRVTLPSESRDDIASVQLMFDSVDRAISDLVQGLSGAAPTVSFEVVLASSPNVTEMGPFYFECRACGGDGGTVVAELSPPAILDEPAFARMTPATHTGLYET